MERVRCVGCGREVAVGASDVFASGYRCDRCSAVEEAREHGRFVWGRRRIRAQPDSGRGLAAALVVLAMVAMLGVMAAFALGR